MPDLQPNTSLYGMVSRPPPGSFAGMSLSDLLGLAKQVGDYQTRRAMSDSLSGAQDPNDPTITNFGQAAHTFSSDPRATFKTPADVAAFSQASGQQFQTRQTQIDSVGKDVASLITKPGGPTADDIAHFAPKWVAEGVPQNLIMPLLESADPKNLKEGVTRLWNTYSGNSSVPTVPIIGQGGATTQYPAGTVNYGQPGSQPGSYQSTLNVGTPEVLAKSAAEGASLLASSKNIPMTRNILQELSTISDEAATGPTAVPEERLNQLFQRLFPGSKGTLSADQLSATEKYAKLANQIVQQSPAFGHSDAFLNNAYGANPNIQLSKLGRQGITHWLMGNVEAQATMARSWEQWISTHPGQDYMHYQWLHSAQMPDGTPGWDVTHFDPRPFQYAQMSPDERKKYWTMLPKNERSEFARNAEAYEKRGWVNFEAPSAAQ